MAGYTTRMAWPIVMFDGKMNHRTDILLVHGIGKAIKSDYYNEFVDSIRRKLPLDIDVSFHAINYSEPLDSKEAIIFGWMKGLNYQDLRSFGCFFVGDVLAYAPPEGVPGPGDFYYDVNKQLADKFAEIKAKYPESKKVIIAHSLGTQISFSFAFKEELDHLFVCGSPLLYFSVRFKEFGSYPPKLKGMTNFYNVNDPVATVVGRNPKLAACKDIRVKSWNPRYLLPLQAHSHYFKSDQVHQGIADVLKNFAG